MTQQFHSWVYILKKKHKNPNLKRYMHCNVHSSITHNCQDVESNLSVYWDAWVRMWYIFTMAYCSATCEWNISICNNMDRLGGYYAKWNKYEIEILWDITYMWYLKKNNNKLGNRTKKQQIHRYRELVVTSGKRLREKSSMGGGD